MIDSPGHQMTKKDARSQSWREYEPGPDDGSDDRIRKASDDAPVGYSK